MVTVHVFNPFTDMNMIHAFLLLYCSTVRGGEKQKNRYGLYNSKSKYWVRLKPDSDGIGGVRHPPANFTVGGFRGFLNYVGQPRFCRGCFQFGHTKDDCDKGNCCRNCGQPGHEAGLCDLPKKCDLCGKHGHTCRNCPRAVKIKARSYSEAVQRTVEIVEARWSPMRTVVEETPVEEVSEQREEPEHESGVEETEGVEEVGGVWW